MEEAWVMAITGLKSAGDACVKMILNAAIGISKQMVILFFRCQVKLIYLATDITLNIITVMEKIPIFKYFLGQNNSNEPEPIVISREKIVKGTKKLRRALFLHIDQNFGLKVKSNMGEAVKRLDELRDSITEGDEKFKEALNRVAEINKPFKDGSWQVQFKDAEFKVDEKIEEVSEEEDDETVSMLKESKSDNQVSSNISNEQEALSDCKAKSYEQLNGVQVNISTKSNVRKNRVLKKKLTIPKTKLDEFLITTSVLVGELSRLNTQVGHLVSVSERMADMQYELGVGRKLLSEVEADRNEMKKKLLTLERLIEEEEQYLDDGSCESGFEESEMANPTGL